MIKRYSDHSANERTYLAWIRTAIAIMAFGFLIEKFNLFILYVGKAIGDTTHFQATPLAKYAGLGLFLVGILIIVSATFRFFIYKRHIESETSYRYSARKTKALLSTLLILLGFFLFFYMWQQVL